MFVGQYVSNSVRQRTSGELMAVEQKPDESLRDYIRRFNNEANTIPKLQQEIAVMALMNGLVDSDFKRYLTRKNMPTLAAAFSKAHDYIKSEELMKTSSTHVVAGKGQSQYEGTSSGGSRLRAPAPGRGGGSRQDSRPTRLPMRYNTYTPLNTPRAEIYSVNQNREDWSRSIPMKARPRDVKKYCMFHRDVGHYTEECTQLKDNIEELIRKGYLTQYRLNTSRNQQSAQTVERVDVITGGPIHGGTISGAKKHLAEHRHLVCALDVDNRPRPASIPQVVFTEEDARGVVFPHDDPLVLITKINGADIKRVLVDGGSSANVLFVQAFNEMNIGRQYLKPVSYPVIEFNGSTVRPEGSIVLPVKLGDGPQARDVMAEFLVVDVKSAYNAIIGIPIIHDMQAVVSTYHLAIAYVSNLGAVEKVYGGQVMSKACYVTALKNPVGSAPIPCNPIREGEPTVQDLTMKNFDSRPEETPRSLPGGETVQVELQPGDPSRTVKVGTDMDVDTRCNLISLLRENADVFSFSASEMPGIHPEVMEHKLNVDRKFRPIRQKKRNFSTEKIEAIQAEVNKLLAVGFIEPCTYPEWLANVVMMRKPTGKWRMCVDLTDLNKACPKDCYPLPRIDRLVDSTSGHAMLSFLDAFSGYHQVSMHKADRKKTTFITYVGVYCYKAMPFGLKNAGATYQKLVDKIFKNQKGRNVEVYVDDTIVKSKEKEDHIADLRETFETLRRYQMKLNTEKCMFGVRSGKFLGFMVSKRGIDANPDKVNAVLQMKQPKTIRDIQRLTGRMAGLTRFISKSADKALPFSWPKKGEVIQLYISASPKTVAAVLIVERKKQQKPIYFVSHVLNAPERKYPVIEKMALIVVVAARKLRPYFDAHPIEVLTNHPLEKSLHKMDTSGRLLAWAVELSEYEISYRPITSIKAQAMSDFIVETTYTDEEEELGTWRVSVDGSATATGAGAGIVITAPDGKMFEYAMKFKFKATNNEAEYEAAIAGMQLSIAAEAKRLVLTTDSQLVSSQYSGEYETREPAMVKYLEKMKQLAAQLQYFE
ncbi:uncharacterized protein LOC110727653 [Chenopodium quinoa]|uniref:uncharacterized protein LOC110727653 n=1 Tax=Chenopodium quinoa TaxID=63459 RepID=UPI000B772B35|nr:uncharacterized protein LOC110727653 [Chenopodium quinoa]